MKVTTIQNNPVTFKPEDMEAVFDFIRVGENVQDNLSRSFAVSDVLEEALERLHEQGTSFADDRMLIYVVQVIRDYAMKAHLEYEEAFEKLKALYSDKWCEWKGVDRDGEPLHEGKIS